jgi:hypothetical protein
MNVYDEIALERHRQTKRWGEQNHADGNRHVESAPLLNVDSERAMCEHAQDTGRMTWAHVFREEVAEVLAECGDDTDADRERRLRKELVQVAAVCVQWAECIERRQESRRG